MKKLGCGGWLWESSVAAYRARFLLLFLFPLAGLLISAFWITFHFIVQQFKYLIRGTSIWWEEGLGDRGYVGNQAGEGNGIPLQYSCLENPMDGGAWWAAAHGVAKSQTRLNDFTFTFHFHALEKEMATLSSTLAWRIPGTGSLVGCRLWGRTESDTAEAT